jgi:DNA polymerase I-like protein with 3'-5' exonuclease and polymerase domains
VFAAEKQNLCFLLLIINITMGLIIEKKSSVHAKEIQVGSGLGQEQTISLIFFKYYAGTVIQENTEMVVSARMLPQAIILEESQLQTAVSYFLTQPSFVYDIESQGDYRAQPQSADVTWISLATTGCAITVPMCHERGEQTGVVKVVTPYKSGTKAGKTYNKTVPVYAKAPEQIERARVFEILDPLLSSTTIRKGGHDFIYDLVGVAKYTGYIPPPPYDDTKIGYWLLNENLLYHAGLKEITELRYDVKYDTENVGRCVESFPFETVAYYSYCDAKYDFFHVNWIRQQLEAQGLMPMYRLEMEVLNVMCGMRLAGVRIDEEKLKELRTELSADLVKAESAIYSAAGKKFNIRSNPQKRDILFNEQKLRPWKLTAAGKKAKKMGKPLALEHYSVDDDVLASYPSNTVACALREHGDIDKILGTYVESWLGTEDEVPLIIDSRIHAGFQQYGTVTGRFSCRAPNLQNLPRSTSDLGRRIRDVFIAEPDGKLVVADYSQIELVILAHYIGEGKLYEGFLNGIDPHTMTAAMVLGKDPADVTKVERQDLGKTLGFAVVYGAGLGKVSSMAHITFDEAKRVLKTHEKMFPEIHQFKRNVIDYARAREPVPRIRTLLGRVRRIPELNSGVEEIRMGAERQIFNSLIQGGAADLIKLAMVRMDGLLPDEAKMVLTVHDEIVVTAPDSMVDETMSIMRDSMTGSGIQKCVRVPLNIDIHAAGSWGEAK